MKDLIDPTTDIEYRAISKTVEEMPLVKLMPLASEKSLRSYADYMTNVLRNLDTVDVLIVVLAILSYRGTEEAITEFSKEIDDHRAKWCHDHKHELKTEAKATLVRQRQAKREGIK